MLDQKVMVNSSPFTVYSFSRLSAGSKHFPANPIPKTQNSKLKTQLVNSSQFTVFRALALNGNTAPLSPKHRTQNPEPRTQNSKLITVNSHPPTQNPFATNLANSADLCYAISIRRKSKMLGIILATVTYLVLLIASEGLALVWLPGYLFIIWLCYLEMHHYQGGRGESATRGSIQGAAGKAISPVQNLAGFHA